jgi:hypothetical protein
VFAQPLNLLDGDARRNHAPRFQIVVQAIESLPQPGWNGGAAAFGESHQLRKARDGQDPWHDLSANAGARAFVSIA